MSTSPQAGDSGRDNADLDVQDAIVGVTCHVDICPDFQGLWGQPALNVLHEGLPHIIGEHSDGLTPIDFLQDRRCSYSTLPETCWWCQAADVLSGRGASLQFLLAASKHCDQLHKSAQAACEGTHAQ